MEEKGKSGIIGEKERPMRVKLILFLIWLAFVHAKWEVQIEGKAGWARELPCWRLNVFFRKLLGGKALTGYHTWMMLLFFSFFHGIFIFLKWTCRGLLFGVE